MAVEDQHPRVKAIKAQLRERLETLKSDIQAGRKLEALTAVAWIRSHIDELLCNLGCSPLSREVDESD